MAGDVTTRQMDTIDQAIIEVVEAAPARVSIGEIIDAFVKAGVEAIPAPSMGYRLRRLHKEKRLVYLNVYGDKMAMPMPGKGFRAAGRERVDTTFVPEASGTPSPVSRTVSHDSTTEGC